MVLAQESSWGVPITLNFVWTDLVVCAITIAVAMGLILRMASRLIQVYGKDGRMIGDIESQFSQ